LFGHVINVAATIHGLLSGYLRLLSIPVVPMFSGRASEAATVDAF
jgi:hypothetical protein